MLAVSDFIFPVHDFADVFFNVYFSGLFICAGLTLVSLSPVKEKNSASVKRPRHSSPAVDNSILSITQM